MKRPKTKEGITKIILHNSAFSLSVMNRPLSFNREIAELDKFVKERSRKSIEYENNFIQKLKEIKREFEKNIGTTRAKQNN